MSLLLIVNVYFLTDDSTTSSKDNHNDTLGELDDVNCHPILDDSSHPLLDGVNWPPNEPKKLVISFSITLNRVLLPAA